MEHVQHSPRIRGLFLDIGGVLLTNGWDRRARQSAAEKFGLNYEDMDERHHLTFDTYEVGKLSLDEYLTRVVFHEKRPFSREQFIQFMYDQSKAFPETIGWIKAIKEKNNLKVATVSNEGRELTEYRIRKFELGTFVDFFISSCFVHFRKPDRDIFRLALDTAQISQDEVIYIDDRELFVEVAETLGIHAVLHRGLPETQKRLAVFGLRME